MKITALLVVALSAVAAYPALGQAHLSGGTLLKFETPGLSMIGQSPMRLFDQYHWIGVDYVRSMGVKVEPALPGLGDRALKVESGLALRMGDHHILRIFDQPEVRSEAGPIRHQLVAWLPAPQFYVVSVGCDECAMTYLIDARDGRVADISLPPVMSPSGQLGILWAQDVMGGIWSGPPAVIDFRNHPPVMRTVAGFPNCEQRAQPQRLRPTPVWVDEAEIRLEGSTSMAGEDPNARQTLRLVDGKLQWDCRN